MVGKDPIGVFRWVSILCRGRKLDAGLLLENVSNICTGVTIACELLGKLILMKQ